MPKQTNELGKWKCNTCDETAGVTNGACPNCGPTQTTPVDETAEKIAGVYVEPEIEALEEKQKDTTDAQDHDA